MRQSWWLLMVCLVLPAICYPQKSIESINTYPQQRFVTVAPEVRLEVLDWGGAGRNLVLLPGLQTTISQRSE
jgi:non-heme chloroperoxidase